MYADAPRAEPDAVDYGEVPDAVMAVARQLCEAVGLSLGVIKYDASGGSDAYVYDLSHASVRHVCIRDGGYELTVMAMEPIGVVTVSTQISSERVRPYHLATALMHLRRALALEERDGTPRS